MALMRDVEMGGSLVIDLNTNHKLRVTDGDRVITFTPLYKRGGKYARIKVEAPDDVTIIALPPDGVLLPK
jgi:hypothetical protein